MKSKPSVKYNNISSDAVKKGTDKSWDRWLKLLDAAGCRKMDHKQIVDVVSKKFDIGPWWQQMVTVGYEQARGLRVKHQKTDGFSCSASKTISASAKEVFEAWTDESSRSKWMKPSKLTITTATPNKSIRLKCDADDTRVNVMIYPKGAGKCQVSVEHNKLKNAAAVERTKTRWAGCLTALARHFAL